MISFKPRVYRSTDGCCICRAKSSSSRFTESRKYEEDFAKCFDLKYPRSGQICNACVLLVKRYKCLPAGSQKNWSHVVDSRSGPGTKTLLKFKRKKKETTKNSEAQQQIGKSIISQKFSKIFKKSKKMKLQRSSSWETQTPLVEKTNSIDSDNGESSESSQELSKTTPSVVLFQTQTRASAFRLKQKIAIKQVALAKSVDLIKQNRSKKRKNLKPKKLQHPHAYEEATFFDDNEWTMQRTCCGIFYECAKLNNAIIIDGDQYKICQHHCKAKEMKLGELQQSKPKCMVKPTFPTVVKLSSPLTAINSNMKSAPTLKKHYLYFKRQSESFSQESDTTKTTVKTDDTAEAPVAAVAATAVKDTENSTNSVRAQKSSAFTATPIITTVPSSTVNIKSFNLFNKITAETGKIVKHSFKKLNSAVRLKPHDLMEIKQLVTTADRNNLLNAIPSTSRAVQNNAVIAAEKTTSPKVEDLSLNSAVPATTITNKFNDNPYDSGFDENVQDRKSASPMQQENDAKNRPQQLHNFILDKFSRYQEEPQNLGYDRETFLSPAGNLVTIQKNNTAVQQNERLDVQINNSIDPTTPTTAKSSIATLKFVNTIKSNPNNVVSIGNLRSVKMRPLYNSQAIKHENGITTILPASSLAAANQANQISIQANAPNTITITPAVALVTPSTSSSITSLPFINNRSAVNYQLPHHNLNDNLKYKPNGKAI